MSGLVSTYFAIKRGIILTTLVMSATLTGCASVKTAPPAADAKAKTFANSPDQASFYIYRNEFMGAAIRMSVQVDGKPIGKTGPKTYFAFKLEPGVHTFVSSAENDSMLQVNAEAGKVYYVWQEVKMGIMSAGSKLQLVDPVTGQSGVKESELLEIETLPNALSVYNEKSPAAVSAEQAKPEPKPNQTQSAAPAPVAASPAQEPAPALKVTAAPVPATPLPTTPMHSPINNTPSKINIEKIPFEIGVSSNSVERLAKQNNCPSSKGAGLIYKKGPVEVYRVTCDDGRELKARCELRLCELFRM